MKIKLEELFQALEYLAMINAIPLEDLKLEYQQQSLIIPQKSIDAWDSERFNNVDLFDGLQDSTYIEIQEFFYHLGLS
jgi:hypothetical protein